MLKPLDGLYALGDRVPYWLKLKPFESVEMTVVGSIEGLGQHVGRLGALTCRSAAGVEVSVGGGFTHEERDSLWAVRDALPGRIVEVKVQAGSVATARHPVFLRFRTEREKTEAGPKKTLQTSKT
jgi:ATP-dependent DNA ligase